jgi:hypothetical protein
LNLQRAIAQPALGAKLAVLSLILLCAATAASRARAISPIPSASPAPPSGHWRDASLDDYRAHLNQLTTLLDACAKARDLKTCDPLLVGPDDRVPLGNAANAGHRLIRYGWLRILFSRAEEPDDVPAPPSKKASVDPAIPQTPTPSTSSMLSDAKARLAADLAQAGAVSPDHAGDHTGERAMMAQVLAGRDFRDLEQPSVRDAMMERVGNWLNHLLANAARLRARSAWVGRVLVWGFILAVCVALAWTLLRLERRWRVRLVPEQRTPAPSSPSARNWQLWLEDARRAAASGMWREAIHFVYWAAIARLESRRMWPADRARTPREYLALLAQEDPRRARLTVLTGSFERIWYGGRVAAESDYRSAEEIATALIDGRSDGGSASSMAASGAAVEGGRA